ncbi:type II toxin-antitoxin system RatA family toxin [Colwellia sp. RE-S-Sl-9]
MIECTKEIRATKEALFKITQDYSIRMDWDPFPESYSFINGNKIERGLHLKVVDKAGRSMIVEYVSYKPPLVASIRMVSGPWYIKRFAGSWSFKEIDKNTTKVIFKYNIVSYPTFIGSLVRHVFRKNANKRLSSLKAFVESKI